MSDDVARRSFLSRLIAGLLGGSALLTSLPLIGFIFAPLLRRTAQVWRPVGEVNRFPIGSTLNVTLEDPSPLPWAGVTAKTGAWLRRESETGFVAFSVNCAHLGCPVRWLPQAKLFMCPCHGGVYNADGTVAAGPPPHALTRLEVRSRDGQVEIRTADVPIG
jgi:menaquinol-cytochrome c reductase iron-sulfur subunit